MRITCFLSFSLPKLDILVFFFKEVVFHGSTWKKGFHVVLPSTKCVSWCFPFNEFNFCVCCPLKNFLGICHDQNSFWRPSYYRKMISTFFQSVQIAFQGRSSDLHTSSVSNNFFYGKPINNGFSMKVCPTKVLVFIEFWPLTNSSEGYPSIKMFHLPFPFWKLVFINFINLLGCFFNETSFKFLRLHEIG